MSNDVNRLLDMIRRCTSSGVAMWRPRLVCSNSYQPRGAGSGKMHALSYPQYTYCCIYWYILLLSYSKLVPPFSPVTALHRTLLYCLFSYYKVWVFRPPFLLALLILNHYCIISLPMVTKVKRESKRALFFGQKKVLPGNIFYFISTSDGKPTQKKDAGV